MNLKLTIQLPPDLRTRLAIEAAITGRSNSAVVAELVDGHLELPDDLQQFAASLEKPSTDHDAKASERHGKNTSLYLPALTSLRLHFHMLKTGEDRKSTIIRLVGQHIAPWATYDPRVSYVRDREHGRRKSNDQASISGDRAA